MSKLWKSKSDYRPFHPDSSDDIYDVDECAEDFLPYERFYQNLNRSRLMELLKDAKREHWQALDLSFCGLDVLPEQVWALPDLQILYLDNNERKWNKNFSIPCVIGENNTFKELAVSIDSLSNLRALCLHKCFLTSLPESIGNLSSLQRLDLDNTCLTSLPESIGNLSSLQRLDLDNTCLTSLPESIGNLSSLQMGSISYTDIKLLPESIGNLSNLLTLYMYDINLMSLPESIGKLTKLKFLDMHNTNLTHLPESMRNLCSLEKWDIDGTPLSQSLPPEICKQSPAEVIRYILAMQSGETKRQYFNESKMILVGQGAVGKTSLVNRLLYNSYESPNTTEGINIEKWKFEGADGEPYVLNVWDFGGQEIYHATHQFFLTRRTLYLLIWDAFMEDEHGRMDYWLRTIQSFAGNSAILIVVNKCDKNLGRFKYVDNTVLNRYEQVKKIYYVSCLDNIGIDELRRDIQEMAIHLPLMKTEWFDNWLTVRQELEMLSKKQYFISYRVYSDICAQHGLKTESSLSLAKYLHDLGIIFYYHEDFLLKRLMILSPAWGTDAVYKVLDEQSHTLYKRNGILYYQDLPKIWSNRTLYPSALYPHLLKLMENFQLAFKVNDPHYPTDTYLIAELLEANPLESTGFSPFSGEELLSFRYAYDFLPAGVMTRLIVSFHEYLETVNGLKMCWRKGAYLTYGHAKAKLVLYNGIDRQALDVQVAGETPR